MTNPITVQTPPKLSYQNTLYFCLGASFSQDHLLIQFQQIITALQESNDRNIALPFKEIVLIPSTVTPEQLANLSKRIQQGDLVLSSCVGVNTATSILKTMQSNIAPSVPYLMFHHHNNQSDILKNLPETLPVFAIVSETSVNKFKTQETARNNYSLFSFKEKGTIEGLSGKINSRIPYQLAQKSATKFSSTMQKKLTHEVCFLHNASLPDTNRTSHQIGSVAVSQKGDIAFHHHLLKRLLEILHDTSDYTQQNTLLRSNLQHAFHGYSMELTAINSLNPQETVITQTSPKQVHDSIKNTTNHQKTVASANETINMEDISTNNHDRPLNTTDSTNKPTISSSNHSNNQVEATLLPKREPDDSNPNKQLLIDILELLRTHDYDVRFGGRIINNKKYATSAAIIINQLEQLNKLEAPFTTTKYEETIAFIKKELIPKTKPTKLFYFFPGRSAQTANLYEKILTTIAKHENPNTVSSCFPHIKK